MKPALARARWPAGLLQLRAAAQLLQDALNAQDVRQEEALWTKIIQEYGGLDSNWVPDLVGRAWGELTALGPGPLRVLSVSSLRAIRVGTPRPQACRPCPPSSMAAVLPL